VAQVSEGGAIRVAGLPAGAEADIVGVFAGEVVRAEKRKNINSQS